MRSGLILSDIQVQRKVAQLCPTLCDPMDYISMPWNSPEQNIGVGSFSFLQGIFPTQGSNPDLLQYRWILTSWATKEAQEYCGG